MGDFVSEKIDALENKVKASIRKYNQRYYNHFYNKLDYRFNYEYNDNFYYYSK